MSTDQTCKCNLFVCMFSSSRQNAHKYECTVDQQLTLHTRSAELEVTLRTILD